MSLLSTTGPPFLLVLHLLMLSFGAISLGFPHTSPGLTWPSRRWHVPWGCVETGALADSFTTDCSRRLLSFGQTGR